MPSIPLLVRPADAADAEAAIPLVYSAGPEAFDYILRVGGRTAMDFLCHAFADGRGFQGWRNHWVVVREGQVLGVGAFYSGRDELRLTLGFIWQVLGFYPLRQALGVIVRALQVAPLMKPLTRDMLYVANLGTGAEARSQGIGGTLLKAQMQRAREAGFRRFALDVATTNPRAQQLYESLGLRPQSLKVFRGDRNRSPVPDNRRLELKFE